MASIYEQAVAIREQMTAVNSQLDDSQAKELPLLFELWQPRITYQKDDRRRYHEVLYKCLQAHTSQEGWEPDKTPALWVSIDETHVGTIDDPIPAYRGMEYTYGKYYLDPEDSQTYLCKRGEETGAVVLQYLPHELVGHYFEVVEV